MSRREKIVFVFAILTFIFMVLAGMAIVTHGATGVIKI